MLIKRETTPRPSSKVFLKSTDPPHNAARTNLPLITIQLYMLLVARQIDPTICAPCPLRHLLDICHRIPSRRRQSHSTSHRTSSNHCSRSNPTSPTFASSPSLTRHTRQREIRVGIQNNILFPPLHRTRRTNLAHPTSPHARRRHPIRIDASLRNTRKMTRFASLPRASRAIGYRFEIIGVALRYLPHGEAATSNKMFIYR